MSLCLLGIWWWLFCSFLPTEFTMLHWGLKVISMPPTGIHHGDPTSERHISSIVSSEWHYRLCPYNIFCVTAMCGWMNHSSAWQFILEVQYTMTTAFLSINWKLVSTRFGLRRESNYNTDVPTWLLIGWLLRCEPIKKPSLISFWQLIWICHASRFID